jgi:hypothetical protein
VSDETVPLVLRQRSGAIGQQDDVGTPDGQFQREARAIAFAAIDGEELVPVLPPIAIGTWIDPVAVKLDRTREFWRVVHPPGREQELSRPLPLSVIERDLEPVVDLLCSDDLAVTDRDARVFRDLLDRISPDHPRAGAIPREETTDAARAGVPRLLRIADQDAASAAAKDQSGIQPRRSASDDDNVEQ